MSDHDPGVIAEAYFSAWLENDWERLRGLLADDVAFRGPLASIDGADECVDGMRGLAKILTGIDVRKRFVDGPDVLTWFDLHTSVAPPAPTANWSRVEDGRIMRIQVTFDPRPLAPPG
jgi:hypothetical protein